MKITKKLAAVLVGMMVLAAQAGQIQEVPVYVPNASFELPQTAFVNIDIESWQKGLKPWWYDESGGYFWSQLTGVFLNLPPADPSHIDNCDGSQAAWLFAVPEVELFQELEAGFEVGQCYHLTVGIIGGGGNMKDGVPIEIRLYYRDAENKKVTVGVMSYAYDSKTGYAKHFNDVRLDLPPVRSTDPWASKSIGVQVISTLTLADLDPDTGRAGGFWDLDNIRLTKSLPGDFNGDWLVNFEDFAVMAEQWLLCEQTTTDLTGDGCVSMQDVALLAEFWLVSIQE